MGLFKASCPMYSFSENNEGNLAEQEALVFQFLLQKFLSLLLWYLRNYGSYVSKTLHWDILSCLCSNTISFIRIGFTSWDLWSFSQGDLLQDCSEQQSCMDFYVSLFHLMSLKLGPQNLQYVPFLEHLPKFHLDLFSPRYSNSPQVSCSGMNSGRGWNPNLEGSYCPEYRESEAEFWQKCTSGFYLWPLQFSVPDTFPISGYSECTKT